MKYKSLINDHHRQYAPEPEDDGPPENGDLTVSPCSPLGELGAQRLEDLLSYLPHLSDRLYKAAQKADEAETFIKLDTSNAYWILDLMAFVKTLPLYLAENGGDERPGKRNGGNAK